MKKQINEFFDRKIRVFAGRKEKRLLISKGIFSKYYSLYIYLIDTVASEGETVGIVKCQRMTLNRLTRRSYISANTGFNPRARETPAASSFNLISLISCTQCIEVFYLLVLLYNSYALCLALK